MIEMLICVCKLTHLAYISPPVQMPLQILLQSHSIHATINLEVTGILSELFWSHVILDNTIKFRWNGTVNWRFCVSRGLDWLFLPSVW